MDIGKRIKERREELGMTQTELALKLGYTSKSTIARIETGSNKLKQDKIAAMAKALNTTPAFIMGWEEDDEEQKRILRQNELLLIYINQLNDDGFAEIMKRAEELTQLDKYKKDEK